MKGVNISYKISLMIVCFSCALALLSAVRPPTEAQSVTPQIKVTPKSSAKSGLTLKPKNKRIALVTPVLSKAIAKLRSRLVVDLSEARVYVYWGDKLLSSYPVAVGQPGWETPKGSFKVLQKQRNPVWLQPITGELFPTGPNNPLGDRWISFWSDEQHRIGFHGTNKEQLVGQPVSHGCLRMKNEDIRALYEQVAVGTSVVVRD
jgi:lipoprotein-anchoring transpeptidase ErfK/SrfK